MVKVAFIIGEYPPAERRLREDAAKAYESPEVQVGFISIGASPYGRMGGAEVEAVHPLFHQAYLQAEREGYDAAVPLGMIDLGVDGGRCLVDIPIIAPSQACFHIASMLGERFGLISYESYSQPRTRARARRYGMEQFIAGFRTVSMPKSDFTANRDRLVETFLREARALIKENGVDVNIPTGVSQCPVQMKPEMLTKELGVPIVEGIGAPIRLAAMFAHMGYRHSRIRWPRFGEGG
jgi:Asp/Glu/hydantoin racemase